MKTAKLLMSIFVMLAFFGLNEALGQWGTNGVHIYNTNTGNVGIGTNTPGKLLDVSKNMTEPTIRVFNNGGTGGATFQMMDLASGADWKFKATLDGGFKIRDNGNGLDVILVEPNSASNSLYIDAAGNVAMGQSTTDGHRLNVLNYIIGKAAVQGLDKSGSTTYATGMLGILAAGAMGLPIDVTNIGVLGIKPYAGSNGAGLYGWNVDAGNSSNYGGIFVTEGAASGTNYGTLAIARYATNNFAGKFVGRVEVDGHPNSTLAPDYNWTVLKANVTHTVLSDTRAVEGNSSPADGWGIGVYGEGGYRGVQGYGLGGAYTGTTYGVYGEASGTAGIRIGVYGAASGGDYNWAGYFVGDAYVSSDLRIGTTTQATGYALSVNGKVACSEVLVEALANWPDYVFADDYQLMSLEELEQSIEKNHHLPGLPSAAEIEENGLLLGDMQKKLIEKVEELTLYTIAQDKIIDELRQNVEYLMQENENLKNNE